MKSFHGIRIRLQDLRFQQARARLAARNCSSYIRRNRRVTRDVKSSLCRLSSSRYVHGIRVCLVFTRLVSSQVSNPKIFIFTSSTPLEDLRNLGDANVPQRCLYRCRVKFQDIPRHSTRLSLHSFLFLFTRHCDIGVKVERYVLVR